MNAPERPQPPTRRRVLTTIRCQLAVTFDDTVITQERVKDVFAAMLGEHISEVADWHIRWETRVSQVPLVAARRRRDATRPSIRARTGDAREGA